jgi:hydroxyacylglutathione hydrolase
MIQIRTFTFNAFQENTYILYDETGEAIVIDPGCSEGEERTELKNFVTIKKLTVKYALNTHCHIDHVLGNAFVKDFFKVPLLIHALELPVLKAVSTYASNYGFPMYQESTPDGELTEGCTIGFGKSLLTILFVPGHSPGHVAFYNAAQKIIIGGDVLFHRSIGRTDLPGGDHETLLRSIQKQLFVLPDDVAVYPGHGSITTLGEEKVFNPYCAVTA